ncbi:hypothetical protein K353_00561 [Kitasatospora sp. SolWspMP-SS2h]|nr:hypothetical protein K353_00561 [Kitasatospora sp. SolWspMP-SS2h]
MTATDPPVPALAHPLFFAEPDPGRRTSPAESPPA